MPGLEEDVLGLDVPVHEPQAVSVAQGIGHFSGDLKSVLQRQLLFASQPAAQGFTLHVGHGVVGTREAGPVFDRSRVVQRQDVGMGELGGDLDFAEEALGPQGLSQLGTQHLEGNPAVVLQVLREEDDGHSAVAELALDAVAAGETSLQPAQQIGHLHKHVARSAGAGGRAAAHRSGNPDSPETLEGRWHHTWESLKARLHSSPVAIAALASRPRGSLLTKARTSS